MKKMVINQLFAVTTNGYFILSRNAFRHLMEQISVHDNESFYCYLLMNAHYGEPHTTPDGLIIRRGEIRITTQDLVEFTHWQKSKVYHSLLLLEKLQLLERIGAPGSGHYLITMYEQHCGRAVRKEEQAALSAATARNGKSKTDDNQTKEQFLDFFHYYHYGTGTPEVDQEKARREWAKLTLAEREEALKNVTRYKESVAKREHLKRAFNYLKDKSFKF